MPFILSYIRASTGTLEYKSLQSEPLSMRESDISTSHPICHLHIKVVFDWNNNYKSYCKFVIFIINLWKSYGGYYDESNFAPLISSIGNPFLSAKKAKMRSLVQYLDYQTFLRTQTTTQMNTTKTMNIKDLFFLKTTIREDLNPMELSKFLKEGFKLLKT